MTSVCNIGVIIFIPDRQIAQQARIGLAIVVALQVLGIIAVRGAHCQIAQT